MLLRFEFPLLLMAAIGLSITSVGVGVYRRMAISRASRAAFVIGLLLLSFSIGGITWQRARRGSVVVMVDVSPSTRTAAYRNRAYLNERLQQLLGPTPYRIVQFADGVRADHGEPVLADMACERTVYAPPAAEAVLLFSDARFSPPAAGARTYVVIDPALEEPPDAAVTGMEIRNKDVATAVRLGGGARELSMQGTAATQPIKLGAGVVTEVFPMTASRAMARLSGTDAWPENDAMWIEAPPPSTMERWWVGADAPPGWRAMEPQSLPLLATQYLAPSVIVLNNIAADALATSQDRLQQYVRDLGGSLVILGGDHAFAAGGYEGTPLETLSPLASHPPKPAARWVVLVDGSGSMAGAVTGGTRWQLATGAATRLLPHLPPDDLVTIGSFAEDVTWWTTGKSVRETMTIPLPPPNLSPRGPTNLQHALVGITRSDNAGMPTRLIVVSDADAQIEYPEKLAAEMKSQKTSLSLLAIGEGSGLAALRQIAGDTGGSVMAANDASRWSTALVELSRATSRAKIEITKMSVRFLPPLIIPTREVSPWNRTWLKSGATPLAAATLDGETFNPAGRWQAGLGEVAAVAFGTNAAETAALVEMIARPPHDPRFAVTWSLKSPLRVMVDAIEGKKFLNDLKITLEIRDAAGSAAMVGTKLTQTGPGRYEATVPAPRSASFAALREQGRPIGQIAVAGRYAPEFDVIGNDHETMHEIARRTGGKVIDIRDVKPIDFGWPTTGVSLASWFAALGAMFLGIGLIWTRATE
jgi:hypothetical protein